jgi:hypothetical protein
MTSPLLPHSVKRATIFPSSLPMSISLPETASAYGNAEPTQYEAQLQKPLVFNYIAAASNVNSDLMDRSVVASRRVSESGRPSLRIDTERAARKSSRFVIE